MLEWAQHMFLVWTDRKNLEYGQLNAKQARWALFFLIISTKPCHTVLALKMQSQMLCFVCGFLMPLPRTPPTFSLPPPKVTQPSSQWFKDFPRL